MLTTGRMTEILGAAAFMTALIDAGIPLALVTSAPIELMRARMEEAGVPIPPVVVSADDVDRGKPDPAPYLKAAELLDVPISSCLVLEDAASGYSAARRAGAQVLLVGDGVPEADSNVPGSRTSPGSPSPSTSIEPGTSRAARQKYCWGREKYPARY